MKDPFPASTSVIILRRLAIYSLYLSSCYLLDTLGSSSFSRSSFKDYFSCDLLTLFLARLGISNYYVS